MADSMGKGRIAMYKFMNLWKLNVVHLAPDGGGSGGSGGSSSEEGGEGSPEGNEEVSEGEDGGGSDKRFTQDEVNRLMSREKRKGRASLLKELGLNPEDKDAVSGLKKLLEEHQTDSEKKEKTLKDAQDTAAKETSRANAAERKLSVLMAGCQKEYVEEVTTLAAAKVDEDTDFDKALEEVKKKFPTFFGEDGTQDTGTGSGQGHRRKKTDNPGSFGSRLAQSNSTSKKNPYFNN